MVQNFNKWVDERQPPFPVQKLVAKVAKGEEGKGKGQRKGETEKGKRENGKRKT